MTAQLTPEQVDVLLRPIRPGRVAKRDGQSNVEAYDVRAHLTRIFGFGRWDEIAVGSRLLYEEEVELKNGKPGYKVGYSADRCIRVRDQDGNLLCEHHGSAVGEAQMPTFKRGDCHDFALKKAQSQALKRAAINLGDQFGLSLYRKGSTEALIGRVVGHNDDVGDGRDVPEMHEPDVVEGYDPEALVDDEQPEPETFDDHATHVALAEPEQLPLAEPPPPDAILATAAQIKAIQTMFGIMGVKDRSAKLHYVSKHGGRTVASSKELTIDEAAKVIDRMQQEPKVKEQPQP